MNEAEHWAIWLGELRRWATTCLSKKEAWQVRVLGDHWVCPYCVKVKALFASKGVEFREVDLTNSPDELADLVQQTSMRTVPQVFIGKKFCGGFTDVEKLDTEGKLDKFLQGDFE